MSPFVARGGHANDAEQRLLSRGKADMAQRWRHVCLRKLLFSVDGQFHYWRILSPHMANEAPE
jgi:hypothetical protein